jgi:hypothetical protein
LVVDPSMATVRAIGVDGKLAEVDEAGGAVVLTLEGLPPDGAVVSIETLDRQPLRIDLLDWSWGLPAVDGVELAPRPESLVRRPRWLTDSLLVRGEQWF